MQHMHSLASLCPQLKPLCENPALCKEWKNGYHCYIIWRAFWICVQSCLNRLCGAGGISIFPGLLVFVDLVLVLVWLQGREVLWALSENTENPVASLLSSGLKMNGMNRKILNRKGSGRKLIRHKMFCLEMRFNAAGKFSSADKALLKKKKRKRKPQTKGTPQCPWAELGK